MKLYSSLLLAPRLDEVTLRALVYGETCVLRIPDFCPLPVRERLLSFTRQSRLEPYQAIAISEGRQTVKNLGVHRVGTPFNLTYSSGSLDDYYAKVSTMTQALRDACAPILIRSSN